MTATSLRCATRYCGCGRCYSPGSLVGDWVRRRAHGLWRGLRRLVGRPHRFEYDAQGAVLLPAWVPLMFDGDLIGDETGG